jgi:hypothetical protein
MLKSEGAEMTSFLSWWDGFFVVGVLGVGGFVLGVVVNGGVLPHRLI